MSSHDQVDASRRIADRVTLEVVDGVATLRLDSPPLNMFDTIMRRALQEAHAELVNDESVRCVVLWGGTRCFAAGADIEQLQAMQYEQILGWNRSLQRTFTALAELPVPVIAAINGYALGGGLELALCADYRVAATDATFGQPEILLGIIPGSGGTQRLTRIVGRSRAKELLMTGRSIGAEEAVRLGLVDETVPAGQVVERAVQLARRIARGPRFAVQAVKEAVDAAEGPLDTGLALERALIAGLFASDDRVTGMDSFLRNGPGRASFS